MDTGLHRDISEITLQADTCLGRLMKVSVFRFLFSKKDE